MDCFDHLKNPEATTLLGNKKGDDHEFDEVSLLPFFPGCTGDLSLEPTAVMDWSKMFVPSQLPGFEVRWRAQLDGQRFFFLRTPTPKPPLDGVQRLDQAECWSGVLKG